MEGHLSDQFTPSGARAPDSDVNPTTGTPVQPPAPPPPVQPPAPPPPVQPPAVEPPGAPPAPADAAAGKGGRLRTFVVVGVIVAFLAIVLYVVRNNVDAGDLAVGDCFNVPTGEEFSTVEKLACTESHTAEVIFVGEYDGEAYPISLSLGSFAEENCDPAFEMYAGRPFDTEELSMGSLYPTRDAWSSGDRTITCYVSLPDGGPMTESVKTASTS
jgi:hypothetical protein